MHKRHLPAVLLGAFFSIFITWSCTKIDTTNLGSDLIPAVDNVHTFADTLRVDGTTNIFNDSTRIARTDNFVLGKVNNDPLFGKTTANVYVSLKPAFYPFYFGNAGDTTTGPGTGLDSVILCLSYKGTWGDTTLPQTLEVYEVNDPTFRDSIRASNKISYAPATKSTLLGSAQVDVRTLKNQVKFAHGKDSTTNQIRIRLSNSDPFVMGLFSNDTLTAYKNDSTFRNFNHGLAIKATGSTSNALMYISLTDANTRMEVHYRKRRANVIDTTYTSFRLKTDDFGSPSSTANNIIRDRSTSEMLNSPQGLYLQATPGTYLSLNVPRLSTFKDTNRIIHRASLILESIPHPTDTLFTAPPYIYVDLKDTGSTVKYKSIYYDLNPGIPYDPDNATYFYPGPGNIAHDYLGDFPRKRLNTSGQTVNYYNINISRYIQRMVTRHAPNYEIRISAPYTFSYPQYSVVAIPFDNPLAFGRIRIGNTDNPQYRLRLVIVWSKI